MKIIHKLSMLNKKMRSNIMGGLLSLCFPLVTYASSGETPVSQGLGYITAALTGKTGITLATLAIMGVGLGCLLHKIEWKMFAYTIAAIGIVFGAGGIANAIKDLVH